MWGDGSTTDIAAAARRPKGFKSAPQDVVGGVDRPVAGAPAADLTVSPSLRGPWLMRVGSTTPLWSKSAKPVPTAIELCFGFDNLLNSEAS